MKKSKKHKIGMAPGSLVYMGEMTTEKPTLGLIDYCEDHLNEKIIEIADLANIKPDEKNKIWLNLSGIQDPNFISEIGKHFNLHPLVLEDILNTDQRPKVESYGEYLYVVLRNFELKRTGNLF